jgi:hypothetical protein
VFPVRYEINSFNILFRRTNGPMLGFHNLKASSLAISELAFGRSDF